VRATRAPDITPVIPTSTPTQSVTKTSIPTVPASTSTIAPPTTATLPGPNAAKETQQAQVFCYQDPRKALDDFLTYLYQGEYEKAARLYGGIGDFPNHRTIPPNTKVEERIKIESLSLASFCEGYGTCLKHAIQEESVPGFEGAFTVNFYKESGEIFTFVAPVTDSEGNAHFEVIGPEFRFRVQKVDGCYKSLDVPPITP
jgi:hypothetical protein